MLRCGRKKVAGIKNYTCKKFDQLPSFFICNATVPCSPIEMFHNRLEVESIYVKNAVKLDGNHLLVVYKQEAGHIERRVVEGPTIFIPSAHEW